MDRLGPSPTIIGGVRARINYPDRDLVPLDVPKTRRSQVRPLGPWHMAIRVLYLLPMSFPAPVPVYDERVRHTGFPFLSGARLFQGRRSARSHPARICE
jgi:hypothetical protein